VPAGFALKITGGDLGAWTRVYPPTSSAPPPAETPAAPEKPKSSPRAESPAAPGAVVSPPQDVEIRPREQQSSVEEMLASVLSESTATDDEAAGAAPLSIDGGTVVELPSATGSPTPADDLPTVVRNALLDKPPAEADKPKLEGGYN